MREKLMFVRMSKNQKWINSWFYAKDLDAISKPDKNDFQLETDYTDALELYCEYLESIGVLR